MNHNSTNKTKRLNIVTFVVRGILFIISVAAIAVIFELSKNVIPVSAFGGFIRGIIVVLFMTFSWKKTMKLFIQNPFKKNVFYNKLNNLPTRCCLLSIVLWFLIPIVLFLQSINDEDLAILLFIYPSEVA